MAKLHSAFSTAADPDQARWAGYDLFLSFAFVDQELARRLCSRLEAYGVRVWLDVLDSRPGQPLAKELAGALTACSWFVALITDHYSRQWTEYELNLALSKLPDGHVVPVLVGPAELPPELPGTIALRVEPARGPAALDEPAELLAALVLGRANEIPAIRRYHAQLWQPAGKQNDPSWEVPHPHRRVLLEYLRSVEAIQRNLRIIEGVPLQRLEQVYVRLTARALPDRVPGGARLAVDSRHALEDLVLAHPTRRWALQGDPGSGKSTALKRLAHQLATRVLAPLAQSGGELAVLGRTAVPLLVPLALLEEEGPTPCEVAAREHAVGRRLNETALAEALHWAVEEGRALVLLDGWDEVRFAAAAALQERVASWASRYPQAAFVLTSRRFGYLRPATDWTELELLPLEPEARQELLAHLLEEPGLSRALEWLRTGSMTLQELAGNPLLLTLIALLLRERSAPGGDGAQGPLPGRRVELYREVIGWLLRGGGHRGPRRLAELPVAELQAALAELALYLLQAHAGPWSTAELVGTMRQVPRLAALLSTHPRLLEELASDTNLLHALDRGQTRWNFWHRSLLEYLAAEGLQQRTDATQWVTKLTEQLASPDTHHLLGRWAEVLALYAGLTPDPRSFLQELYRLHPDLALRAMASCEELPIREVVEQVGLVGAGAPGLLHELLQRGGEREDTARLLGRLAQGTTELPVLQLLGAALLAIGAELGPELAEIRRRAGGALALGIPDQPWAQVPAGTFLMGSPEEEEGRYADEGPQHPVTLRQPFRLLATPVTQALYLVVTGKNPSHFQGDLRCPVEQVDWDEAVRCCEALAQLRGQPVRLPREAEWECACRAGTTTRFWYGDQEADLARVGWYEKNSGGHTHPVGEKPANDWGLYDMHGNVWEWCHDEWVNSYAGRVDGVILDLAEPLDPEQRDAIHLVRGGGWHSSAQRARAAYRLVWWPENQWQNLGLRVLLPPPQLPAIDDQS